MKMSDEQKDFFHYCMSDANNRLGEGSIAYKYDKETIVMLNMVKSRWVGYWYKLIDLKTSKAYVQEYVPVEEWSYLMNTE